MFLQELFLAMNISGGPCIDLTYTNCILPKKWASFGNTLPPKLSMFYFESSWLKAKERNWPQLNLLSFSETWEWFEGNKIRGLELAKHSSQIALFSILHLTYSTDLANSSSVLLLSQALESLFSTKKENILSVLKERIALLLGTPPENKNWINKFYELRSRIIHGDQPIIRPSSYCDFSVEQEYYEKYLPLYMDYSEMASLVLFATIQDLIINSAKGFNFKQSIERY